MLILIGLLPADFALNNSLSKAQINDTVAVAAKLETHTREVFGGQSERVASNEPGAVPQRTPAGDVITDLGEIRATLNGKDSVAAIPADARFNLRTRIMRVDSQLAALEKTVKAVPERLAEIKKERSALRGSIDYAPGWVIALIALSLGIGTMIGWKRIVVTVGEKIGKTHLTYAQGASAEIVAAATIGLSTGLGLPVSTTHVLSSGIAGTMIAQKSGLQSSTIRNIALAWVLTLPAAMLLGGGLFLLFRAIIPDAHAATTTPTVHFDPASEDAALVPFSDKPLHIQGSNTIGAALAPALAEGLLRKLDATDISTRKDEGGHAWVVTGRVASQSKPVEIDIDAAGSATAFEGLAKGECHLGMASRIVTDAEAERIRAAGHGDMRAPASENVIGLDGIAVVVNAGNPLKGISVDDLAKIFDGDTTNWAALGGSGAINVLARDDRSGTYDTFKALVLGDHALTASAKRFADNDALSAAVAGDPQAIGFAGMSHVGKAKALAVSQGAAAIAPSRFSVATEDYSLSRRLYLYEPTPATHPLAAQLVAFAQSSQGQGIVDAQGFVDLAASAAKDDDSCSACPPAYTAMTRGAKRLPYNFRFLTGSSELDSKAQRDVGRVAAAVHAQRGAQVVLLGFADNQGNSDANVQVSRDRAKGVADRLEAYGVHATLVEGLGDQMPIASNDNLSGRQRNRRVEVWVKQGGE
jgi:phosphate transport system substrate-binding protein